MTESQNHESAIAAVTEPQNKLGPVDVLSVVNLTKDDLRYKLMARKKKTGDVDPKILSETGNFLFILTPSLADWMNDYLSE